MTKVIELLGLLEGIESFESLISDLKMFEKEERKIHEYPTMSSIISFIEAINKAKGKKLKDLTVDFDSYCKLGIGWEIKGMPGSDKIVERAYNFAIERRKTAFPRYSLVAIDKAIVFVQKAITKEKSNKGLKEYLRTLTDIKELLQEPWRVGLEEETQFPTLKREVSHDLKFILKKMKAQYDYHILSAFEKEFEKDILGLKKK